MKRIALVVVLVLGVFASAANADPGANTKARTLASTKTEWSTEYDASSYYGAVRCNGKTIVSRKFPGGKDVETCEAVSGPLTNMVAGKDQTSFKESGGGSVGEWESDSGDGKRTTDFHYSVNKKLTKFKLVAIYPAPEEA